MAAMALMALDRLSEPSWPVAFQQHPVFAAALSRLGVAHRALGWSAGGVSGEVLLMARRLGPLAVEVGSRVNLPASVAADLAREGRCRLVALTPETAMDPPGWVPVMSPAHVAEWDLTGRAGAREAALSGAWRTALRKARRAGLSVERLRPDAARLGTVLARDLDQQRRKGYRALPGALVMACPPGVTELYRAHLGGRSLAEALVLRHAPSATYHLGWSSDEGRAGQAMNLLLWEAASGLAAEGFERFDLGLVATDRAPGLARFKIGTGARVRPLGATVLHGPLTGAVSRWHTAGRSAA